MQKRIEGKLAEWAKLPEVPLLAALKRLAVEAVAENIMGITAADDVERLLADYAALEPAFTGLPIPLPGTAYGNGLKAVDRIFETFDGVVKKHRENPTDDGLSRILAATAPSGTKINDDQAKRELHHLVIAGRVVYAHLVGMILHLAKHEEVRRKAAEEVAKVTPSGPLALEKVHELAYTKLVLMEVKRVSPVVPGMFATAKEDIALYDHVIPKGWMILFGLYQTHLASDVYPDPLHFEPARFAAPREEQKRHRHAFCPHGPGAPKTSHHCAGTDYATELAMVFTTLLLRGYTWELPEQDLTFDWSKLTPDPKGGLVTRVRKAGEKAGGAR
jgi:cytochrome P450